MAVALLAACTGPDGSSAATGVSTGTDEGTPPVPASASSLPGRLLVVDAGGSLVTVRPDGSERRTLAVASPGILDVTGAAWAPDGQRIVWSQIDRSEGATSAQLVTSDAEGADRRETASPLVPFYLSWDPTSSRVAFLGSTQTAVHLGVLDTDPKAKRQLVSRLDQGRSYFFSWAPGGDRLLVHVGAERLDELDLDGSLQTIERAPGLFQAPVWSADGSTFVYAVRGSEGHQSLVSRRADGGRTTTMGHADGALSFVVSPDGSKVAYQALGPEELDLYDRDLPHRATHVGVTIIDRATGDHFRLSTQPALAFSWSPDGERLAILEPIYHPTGTIYFRWVVWDGTNRTETGAFTPGLALLQSYAPFFSQYAQSVSMWAPDGSAFAYPAVAEVGPPMIWIQPTQPDAQPYPVGRGTFVAWSPSP